MGGEQRKELEIKEKNHFRYEAITIHARGNGGNIILCERQEVKAKKIYNQKKAKG